MIVLAYYISVSKKSEIIKMPSLIILLFFSATNGVFILVVTRSPVLYNKLDHGCTKPYYHMARSRVSG